MSAPGIRLRAGASLTVTAETPGGARTNVTLQGPREALEGLANALCGAAIYARAWRVARRDVGQFGATLTLEHGGRLVALMAGGDEEAVAAVVAAIEAACAGGEARPEGEG